MATRAAFFTRDPHALRDALRIVEMDLNRNAISSLVEDLAKHRGEHADEITLMGNISRQQAREAAGRAIAFILENDSPRNAQIKAIIDKYALTEEEVKVAAQLAFDHAGPHRAADIAHAYSLTDWAGNPLLIKVYEDQLRASPWHAFDIAIEYELGGKKIKEAKRRLFQEKLLEHHGHMNVPEPDSRGPALTVAEKRSIAEWVYDHINRLEDKPRKLEAAIGIAEKYNLGAQKVKSAAERTFEAFMLERDYFQAVRIANKYKLAHSKLVLAQTELVIGEMRSHVLEVSADKLIREFGLDDKAVRYAAEQAYKRCIDSQSWGAAANIADHYGLGKEFVSSARRLSELEIIHIERE